MLMGIIGDKTPAGGAGGSVLIAHTAARYTSASSGVTTSAVDTTGANLIVACVAADDSLHLDVTDNKGNGTYTKLTGVTGAFGAGGQLHYFFAPTVGAGHTFTLSAVTNAFASFCVAAFKQATTSPFDVENGAAGVLSTVQSGSITPSSNNYLVCAGVAFGGVNGNTTISSISAPFAITDTLNIATMYGCSLAWSKQSTATSANPTWTFNQAENSAAVIASFKGT